MHPDHHIRDGMSPVFTIAIPTFNRAEWLARCVSSALSQTYDSFEVLVSDNGIRRCNARSACRVL